MFTLYVQILYSSAKYLTTYLIKNVNNVQAYTLLRCLVCTLPLTIPQNIYLHWLPYQVRQMYIYANTSIQSNLYANTLIQSNVYANTSIQSNVYDNKFSLDFCSPTIISFIL